MQYDEMCTDELIERIAELEEALVVMVTKAARSSSLANESFDKAFSKEDMMRIIERLKLVMAKHGEALDVMAHARELLFGEGE